MTMLKERFVAAIENNPNKTGYICLTIAAIMAVLLIVKGLFLHGYL